MSAIQNPIHTQIILVIDLAKFNSVFGCMNHRRTDVDEG